MSEYLWNKKKTHLNGSAHFIIPLSLRVASIITLSVGRWSHSSNIGCCSRSSRTLLLKCACLPYSAQKWPQNTSEFSFGVWRKEPFGHFVIVEKDGLVLGNCRCKVFVASQADFVPIFVFSDVHRDWCNVGYVWITKVWIIVDISHHFFV